MNQPSPTNQPTNQPINQPTSQPTNQPTNQQGTTNGTLTPQDPQRVPIPKYEAAVLTVHAHCTCKHMPQCYPDSTNGHYETTLLTGEATREARHLIHTPSNYPPPGSQTKNILHDVFVSVDRTMTGTRSFVLHDDMFHDYDTICVCSSPDLDRPSCGGVSLMPSRLESRPC